MDYLNKNLHAPLSTTWLAKYTIAERTNPIDEMPQLDIKVIEI